MARRTMKTLFGAVLAPLLFACAGILDIEEATFDPALEEGAGGRSAGGGGNGTGGTPERTICEEYCDVVMANCSTPEVKQWANRNQCLEFCLKLDPGTREDTAGDTVGCRLRYANAAEGDAELELNCPIAGPGGNGVCGDNCDGFCRVAVQTCRTQTPLMDALACRNGCASLPDPGGYNSGIQTGFTLQCRLYHLSAAQTDPILHCPHVAGVGPCSPPAAN